MAAIGSGVPRRSRHKGGTAGQVSPMPPFAAAQHLRKLIPCG